MQDLIRVEDILIGPAEAQEYLNSISRQPLGVRTIASYVTMCRIPILKRGTTTLFSKAQLAEWERMGRPNTAQELEEVFS